MKWYVSQQPPTDQEGLNRIDITANLAALATDDPSFIHLKVFGLPQQPEKLVLNTAGIIQLGESLARSFLIHQ